MTRQPGAPSSIATEAADATEITVVSDFDRFFADEFDGVARAHAMTVGSDELGRDAATEGMARAYQR